MRERIAFDQCYTFGNISCYFLEKATVSIALPTIQFSFRIAFMRVHYSGTGRIELTLRRKNPRSICVRFSLRFITVTTIWQLKERNKIFAGWKKYQIKKDLLTFRNQNKSFVCRIKRYCNDSFTDDIRSIVYFRNKYHKQDDEKMRECYRKNIFVAKEWKHKQKVLRYYSVYLVMKDWICGQYLWYLIIYFNIWK